METFAVQNPDANKYNPLEEALKLQKIVKNPLIGLAHPKINYIIKNIEEMEKNNIFLELNSDKLFRDPTGKERIISNLKELLQSHSKIKLSIGSDAHIMFTIGDIKVVWEFIEKNGLEKRIIFYK